MNEDEFKNRVESELITRSFQVSGMPLSIFNEVDTFCKQNFGDSRWTMIWTLVKAQQEDYKFAMLFDKLEDLEIKYNQLVNKPVEEKKDKGLKTFGRKEE